jgi:hypothetical protein
VLNPTAPAAIASRTSARIASISSAVAARVCESSPITKRRTAEWPTNPAAFTAMRPSNPARKSPKVPPANVTPSCSAGADMPSTRESISSSHPTSFGFAGAIENPQLPMSTVVTPCHDAGDAVGSKCSCAS